MTDKDSQRLVTIYQNIKHYPKLKIMCRGAVLTSSQMWRRQSITGITRENHDFLYKEMSVTNSASVTKSASADSIITKVSSMVIPSLASVSFDNLMVSKLRKKKVHFCPAVRMVLIPTTGEYKDAGLSRSLWYNPDDLRGFKDALVQDIRNFMHINKCRKGPQAAFKAMCNSQSYGEKIASDDNNEHHCELKLHSDEHLCSVQ